MKSSPQPKNLKKLAADENGAVFIWVTGMVFVIFGLVALAIDGSRYFNLNSNLQEIADGAALAGAKELNGAEDAIERARNAAITYLNNNSSKWSDNAPGTVEIAGSGADAPQFFQTPGGSPLSDGQDEFASYIRVTTIDRSINTTFASVFGTREASTKATAMAKVGYSICKPIQSFMCNPFETVSGYSPGAASNWKDSSNASRGDMFVLTNGSVGAPGSWGFIYPGASTPSAMESFWAASAPATCQVLSVDQSIGEVRTGSVGQNASPGMNTRFGIRWSSGTAASAPIVLDGYKKNTGANCSNTVDNRPTGFIQADPSGAYATKCGDPAIFNLRSCPLPRDRVLTTSGHAWSVLSKGTGPALADLEAYWKNQHGTLATYPTGATTRYELYLAEVDALTDPPVGWLWNTSENYQANCTSTTPTTDDPTRRIINVAIVDCGYWSINGMSDPLPVVTETAQFFMTEPATDQFNGYIPSERGAIYGEFIDSYSVNEEGGSIFQIVQLVE